VNDDGDKEEELQHEDGSGDFAEEEEADHWPNRAGGGGREIGQLPEEATLDQAADGDEEFVAKVQLPVAVEEAPEAEDVGLHGGDYDNLVGAVGGFVGEEEESVAEGCDEGEDGGDSQGQGGFHGGSTGKIRFFEFDLEAITRGEAKTRAKATAKAII
jgi:hypothetical protein